MDNQSTKNDLIFQGSFFHFKYNRVALHEVNIGKRTTKELFLITSKNGGKFDNPKHNIIIPVTTVGNFFKNPGYKLLSARPPGSDRALSLSLNNKGHYLSLTAKIDGATYHEIYLELWGDEFKMESRNNEFTSDFYAIDGVNFSIRVPVNINNDNTQTSAVLTLVRNGQVYTYDPYTFNEDDVLKKLNTLPLGNDIEILFQLK